MPEEGLALGRHGHRHLYNHCQPLPDPWWSCFMSVPLHLLFLACFISIRHDKRVEKKRMSSTPARAALAGSRCFTPSCPTCPPTFSFDAYRSAVSFSWDEDVVRPPTTSPAGSHHRGHGSFRPPALLRAGA